MGVEECVSRSVCRTRIAMAWYKSEAPLSTNRLLLVCGGDRNDRTTEVEAKEKSMNEAHCGGREGTKHGRFESRSL